MAKMNLLAVTLLAAVIFAAGSAAATTSANATIHAAATAYDLLEKNNLPRGLLPKGVLSYDLQPDGYVDVFLARDCDFSVTVGGGRVLTVEISREASGLIKPGSITDIYGVGVQITYEWLAISSIQRTGNTISFTAQRWRASFPVRNFSVSPSCH